MTTIHILRHGQALHNVERGYPHRDPPLTDLGTRQARTIQQTIKIQPDLIIVSPMTRIIQTMYIVFRYLLHSTKTPVQVWPDLREAHDATCNKGVSRKELADKFPNLDFSACPEKWDFPPHTPDDATVRAERVRRRLKDVARTGSYKNIMVVTHRGIAAFLVQGDRFSVCEHRSYRFATSEEVDKARHGVNVDTGLEQDFGPTVLIPAEKPKTRQEQSSGQAWTIMRLRRMQPNYSADPVSLSKNNDQLEILLQESSGGHVNISGIPPILSQSPSPLSSHNLGSMTTPSLSVGAIQQTIDSLTKIKKRSS